MSACLNVSLMFMGKAKERDVIWGFNRGWLSGERIHVIVLVHSSDIWKSIPVLEAFLRLCV